MKILVTGGLGFIGSNFIRYILNKYPDIEIINVDAMKYGSNPDNLSDIDDGRYTFIKGNVSDYEFMCDPELFRRLKSKIEVNSHIFLHVSQMFINCSAILLL